MQNIPVILRKSNACHITTLGNLSLHCDENQHEIVFAEYGTPVMRQEFRAKEMDLYSPCFDFSLAWAIALRRVVDEMVNGHNEIEAVQVSLCSVGYKIEVRKLDREDPLYIETVGL